MAFSLMARVGKAQVGTAQVCTAHVGTARRAVRSALGESALPYRPRLSAPHAGRNHISTFADVFAQRIVARASRP